MGLGEAIVRVVFWPRVRKARRIGDAAALIGEGRADETLRILATMERRIPPYLGFLFFLTRGRALEALDRRAEAEQAYTAAVFAKQGANVAYVHLAVLCGKERRFAEAGEWLRRVREDAEADEPLVAQVDRLAALLDDVQTGRRRDELAARAAAFATNRALVGETLAAAAAALDRWVDDSPEQAREECDELACFLGERVAAERGGAWLVSLSLEDSVVAAPGGDVFDPFAAVRDRLAGARTLADSVRRQTA
jgi:tetratricopeptide (TPR) repeat protein